MTEARGMRSNVGSFWWTAVLALDVAPMDIRRVGSFSWGCEDLPSVWGATGGDLLIVGQPGVLHLVSLP